MRSKIVSGKLAALLISAAGALSGFEMTENGTAEIVLPEQAHPSSRLAAKELSCYVRKITGKTLPVQTGRSGSKTRVVIGTLDTVKNIPAEMITKLKSMKEREAFGIMARGDTLYIIGKNEVAELYGTYHFLEDKLGVRWLKTANKSDPGEYVPKHDSIVFPDYAEYREPAFFKRALDQCGSMGNIIPVNSKVWANRNGFQTPVPYDGKINYEPKTPGEKERTAFYSARIPRCDQQLGGTHITFSRPLFPLKKTFAEHPEYFALVDGKRQFGHQICISNPDVQHKVADHIIKGLEQNNGKGQFTFGMVDVPTGWCECKNCKALDGNDPRADFNEVSTRFYAAVNRISKQVFQKYPEADLRTWAYSAYRQVPKGIKLDPRLKVQFATHGRCWGHTLDDPKCPVNGTMYKRLLEWRKFHPAVLYTYEYFFCSHGYYACCEEVLAHDLKLYSRLGVTGWKEQAYFEDSVFVKEKERRPDLYPSNWQFLYVAGKMLWNPGADAGKLLDEAESLYYGKAWPVMKKYHALRRTLWADSPVCMGYPRGNPRAAVLLNQPESKERLLGYLAEAERLAGNDKVLAFRINEDKRWLGKYWIEPNDKLNDPNNKPFCAPMIDEKIVIDGNGSDKAWGKAFYTRQFCWRNGKPAPDALKTTVGILSDRDNLYFLITAMEPSPEKLKMTAGRDSKVWAGDCMEIFLYPPSPENTYAQIAVNPRGDMFDALQPGTKIDFNLDVEAKTQILKDRYIIEMRVSVRNLMKLQPGDVWKVHFARDRAVKDALTPRKTDLTFFTINGVSHRDYTAFRPMEIGTLSGPAFENGNFNSLRTMNSVQIKLFQKKGRTVVNHKLPWPWLLNGKNDVLEMCLHPGSDKDYYAKLTKGVLWQIHYGKAGKYKIAFRAKGNGRMKFNVYRYRADANRKIVKTLPTWIAAPSIELEKDWKTYEFELNKQFPDEIFAPAFVHLSGEIRLDDVRISEETDLQYHHIGEMRKNKREYIK